MIAYLFEGENHLEYQSLAHEERLVYGLADKRDRQAFTITGSRQENRSSRFHPCPFCLSIGVMRKPRLPAR